MTTLSYDLCEQLEAAGFPFSHRSTHHFGWEEYEGGRRYKCLWCEPLLDELIAACGEGFDSLDRCGDGTFSAMGAGEIREDLDGRRCEPGCCGSRTSGPTPEEAVAHLWLQLNPRTPAAP